MITFTCDLGDQVRITATFIDVDDGAALTPGGVHFVIRDPAGEDATYEYGVDEEVTLVSTGVYRVVLDCDTAGRYRVRVYSTGTGKAAELGEITVRKNPLA